MITRISLDSIAAAYPYEYRAFTEAYDVFQDAYCTDGELGEHARMVADAARDPGYRVTEEVDTDLADSLSALLGRLGADGITAYPAVLDSETRFEVFVGVEHVTRELIDIMGPRAVGEQFEESDDLYIPW